MRSRAAMLVLGLIVAASQPVSSAGRRTAGVDATLAAIRPEALRAHVDFLADDLLEGRGTGTRGYDIAARYVASLFQAAGLEPGGADGTYFQLVPLRNADLVAEQSSLSLQGAGGTQELTYGRDFILGGDTVAAESHVAAPLAYVGFGITAPELGYDDYARIDVRGKIVVMLRGAPPPSRPTRGPTTALGRASGSAPSLTGRSGRSPSPCPTMRTASPSSASSPSRGKAR